MKRWQAQYLGKPFLIYAESLDEVKNTDWLDKGCEIKEYTDVTYMKHINKIKENGELLQEVKNDRKWRQIYKISHPCGYMLVRLCLDVNDGSYYDITQYQVWESKRHVNPITWRLSNPKETCDIAFTPSFHYNVYSYRKYGQPKLDKPKELKGIKSIGSAEFIHKHCSPQVFIKDNDVWIKHTDYFSPRWEPPEGERIDMPLSYYAKKYFGMNKGEKFIYPDGWGDIVLRSEAWIQLKNIIPVIQYDWHTAHLLITEEQGKFVQGGWTVGCELEWERFWGNVVKVVRENV